MRCGQCSAVVAQDDRFCGDCGAPLEIACPSCGEPVAPGKRFCRACGSPVQAAATGSATVPVAASPGTEPVAKRRVCSVLFCGVDGFTPLSEARNPGAIRELLSQYFAVARTVISRYGGVVEKFIGNAVMAVWGTLVATEGDSERAVRAALDLVAAVAELGQEAPAEGKRA
jgi:class 3 adenylate cyclase